MGAAADPLWKRGQAFMIRLHITKVNRKESQLQCQFHFGNGYPGLILSALNLRPLVGHSGDPELT